MAPAYGCGVQGSASGTGGSFGVFATSENSYALYVDGTSDFIGTMSKPGGSFKIDHPVDPACKYLYHSFVESPDMMNV
jgi:trimeric autotransporter adhesin